jgi:hypothetical protein
VIDASGGGVVPILFPTAGQHAFQGECVSVGELGLVRAPLHAGLGDVLAELQGGVDRRAGRNASPLRYEIGVGVGKKVVCLWAHCHAAPGRVIGIQGHPIGRGVDPVGTPSKTPPEGIVVKFKGPIPAGLQAGVRLEVGIVGRRGRTHRHAFPGWKVGVAVCALRDALHGAALNVETGSGRAQFDTLVGRVILVEPPRTGRCA